MRLSILHMQVFPYNSICVMEQENTQGILESTSVNCIQTKQLQFARKHLESVLPHLEVPVAPSFQMHLRVLAVFCTLHHIASFSLQALQSFNPFGRFIAFKVQKFSHYANKEVVYQE